MPTSDSRVIASQDLTTAGFNGLADSWATSRRIDSYSTYKIRDSFSEASNLVLANNDKVMITALDTGTHASSIGDVGVSGGQTPNSGYFYFNEGQNKLIRIAPLESEVAQRWAEGTLPGGVGNKSAKEWSEDARDSVDEILALNPVTLEEMQVLEKAMNQLAYIDFTTKPDGAPPTQLDSGQAVDFIFNTSGRVPILSGSRLKINPVGLTISGVADYYQATLSDTAHRVGCEFTWPASADYGSGTVTDNGQGNMTLAAWGSVYEGGGANVPASWCHLSIVPGTGPIGSALWFVCAGDGIARFKNVKTQTFVNPPRDGSSRWHVDAVLDLPSGMAYARLPDGSVMTLSDEEITSFMTSVGVTPYTFADVANTPVILVEHFANAGANSAIYPEFTAMWGETETSNAKPWLFKGSTLLEELKGDRYLFNQIPSAIPSSISYAPTTALAAPTTNSAANVDPANAIIECVAGVSGKITYDISAYYDWTGTDRVFQRLVIDNGYGTTPARVVDLGVSGQQRVARCVMPISGLTPGLTYIATLQHFAVTGGLATLRAGGSGGTMVPPLTITATPT